MIKEQQIILAFFIYIGFIEYQCGKFKDKNVISKTLNRQSTDI